MLYNSKIFLSIILISVLFLFGCAQINSNKKYTSEYFQNIELVVNMYYDSLSTNNKKKFIELSTENFVGQKPSEDIKTAKLIKIVSYDIISEKESYLSSDESAHNMYEIKCLQVVEKITYNHRWAQKKTKYIILVKETEQSNWKIAQVGK